MLTAPVPPPRGNPAALEFLLLVAGAITVIAPLAVLGFGLYQAYKEFDNNPDPNVGKAVGWVIAGLVGAFVVYSAAASVVPEQTPLPPEPGFPEPGLPDLDGDGRGDFDFNDDGIPD